MKTPVVDEAAVEAMARAVGYELAPERRAIVAERLNEMFAIAADLHTIDYQNIPPAAMFVPTWPIELTEEDMKWTSSLI
jgi:hypothetical protein